MELTKEFFQKAFSEERMERYFDRFKDSEAKAMELYRFNLLLSESMYVSLSVLEVTLRNALCVELEKMTGRKDWYMEFKSNPNLVKLYGYVVAAQQHIANRGESVCVSKVVAELTLGFWVSLLNAEYEKVLWKDLRRAFPNMLKCNRQRRNVSAPLNRFRVLRNRVFHNEPICWNLHRVEQLHDEIIEVIGWINKDVPQWVALSDRCPDVIKEIKKYSK